MGGNQKHEEESVIFHAPQVQPLAHRLSFLQRPQQNRKVHAPSPEPEQKTQRLPP